MLDTAGLIDLETRLGAHNYKPLDVVLTKGKGVWVTDIEGNRYLDCLAAYSAVNQGHCHPKILAAMVEQASRLTLTSRAFRNDQLGRFYEELAALTNSHKVLPMNSGAEAVETAIKAVRKWGYEVKGVPEDQAEIIVCAEQLPRPHPRRSSPSRPTPTPAAASARSRPASASSPSATPTRSRRRSRPTPSASSSSRSRARPASSSRPPATSPASASSAPAHGVTLILDEIQTGLGRTGKLLAEEHEGIEADVTLIGKALGGGFYPVSAVLSNSDVLGVLKPGQHGSTFGGNPLACAVARAALQACWSRRAWSSARPSSAPTSRPASTPSARTASSEVRGRGLMLAVELHADAGPARPVVEALRARGILAKETHGQTIRLSPPLVIERAEIDWALERIAAVLH